MSQPRVTQFFPQKKKSSIQETRQLKGRTRSATASVSRDNGLSGKNTALHPVFTPSTDCPKALSSSLANSIHEDFVRNIFAATEVDREETDANVLKIPASPVTPKRSSVDADLGSVASTTNNHSTAKKRRQLDSSKHAQEDRKTERKTARKKLILPPKDETTEKGCEGSSATYVALVSHGVEPKNPAERTSTAQPIDGGSVDTTTMSKEDLMALKSRLKTIKRKDQGLASTTPTNTTPVAGSDEAASSKSPPDCIDIAALKKRVARAKELSAKSIKTSQTAQDKDRDDEEQDKQDSPGTAPAYQRYHALGQDQKPSLTLPYQYKLLAEMFRSADTIVGMLYNRSETVTFAKVQQGVRDMMRKHFEQTHLGQIKAVFPSAYTFRQERNIPTFNSSIKKGSYQLTLEPVISSETKEARPLLSASFMLERRHVFHQNLVCLVKQHHTTFLSSLVPALLVPEDKVTRWHPRFPLDTVPAIQPSSLPQPPPVETLTTAQQVLDRARSLLTPKMEKALNSAALKSAAASVVSEGQQPASPHGRVSVPPAADDPPLSAASSPATARELKGVSQALLDRIRAKEAQKMEAAMTRNPVQERRLLMMSRLTELARILRTVFVAERKPALIMEVACNRMVASYRSALTAGEMEKHLQLLAELVPDWLTIHLVRKDFYLKLCKNMDLHIVQEKLSRSLKEEQTH